MGINRFCIVGRGSHLCGQRPDERVAETRRVSFGQPRPSAPFQVEVRPLSAVANAPSAAHEIEALDVVARHVAEEERSTLSPPSPE